MRVYEGDFQGSRHILEELASLPKVQTLSAHFVTMYVCMIGQKWVKQGDLKVGYGVAVKFLAFLSKKAKE